MLTMVHQKNSEGFAQQLKIKTIRQPFTNAEFIFCPKNF